MKIKTGTKVTEYHTVDPKTGRTTFTGYSGVYGKISLEDFINHVKKTHDKYRSEGKIGEGYGVSKVPRKILIKKETREYVWNNEKKWHHWKKLEDKIVKTIIA